MIADKLKQAILQAAIQGKLTEQLPSDGDARDLVKQIKAEKDKLIKEGKIKKEKPLPGITEDEIPFEIPANWCWVRLENICKSISDGDHQPPPQALQGIPFLVISNVSTGIIDFTNVRHVSQVYFDSLPKYRIPQKGNILFTVTGSYGIPILVNTDNPFCFQRHIALLKVQSEIVAFLMHCFHCPLIKNQCDKLVTGTAQKTLGLFSLKNLLLPLPPLAEQQRIVERINALLPDLEKLHKEESQLETLQQAFPKKMKDSLLQAAIQGKLTEQLASDGDARDLVKQIKAEKDKRIKEGKIKKEKPLPEITEDEIPFEIPQNWCWVRLAEIISVSSGHGLTQKELSPAGKYPVYGGNGITGYYDDYFVPKETLVIGRVGFYCGCVHKVINDCWVTDNALIVSIHNPSYFDIDFFRYLLVFCNLKQVCVSTAQPVISGKRIYPLIVAIPPLAEQQRIVERLEQLLPLCDKLN